MNTSLAVVRGANDVASAVALSLARHGWAVLLEALDPVVTRRGQSFADAMFEGAAALEGITAFLTDTPEDWVSHGNSGNIALTRLPLEKLAARLRVDARMRKRAKPDDQRGLADVVIGLGPNFVVGDNVDLAVETAWNDDLGKVITSGPTGAFAGDPKPIGGYGRERYVYSPAAGVFRTGHAIGQRVVEGETVARIEALPIPAPKTGILRGLVRDGVMIPQGAKVVEVVPAGAKVFGIGERPAAIAAGVLAAICLRELQPGA
jgi:xanthine dehydrogenase accessory factor